MLQGLIGDESLPVSTETTCDLSLVVVHLGYLFVEDNSDKYAQVRMIAKIKTIHDCHTDPATGKTYRRELVPEAKLKEYLNYSDSAGNEMIDDAMSLAKEQIAFR